MDSDRGFFNIPDDTLSRTRQPTLIPGFVRYTNDAYGFGLQYPMNWKVLSQKEDTNFLVTQIGTPGHVKLTITIKPLIVSSSDELSRSVLPNESDNMEIRAAPGFYKTADFDLYGGSATIAYLLSNVKGVPKSWNPDKEIEDKTRIKQDNVLFEQIKASFYTW
jgi:hypothetical protein